VCKTVAVIELDLQSLTNSKNQYIRATCSTLKNNI